MGEFGSLYDIRRTVISLRAISGAGLRMTVGGVDTSLDMDGDRWKSCSLMVLFGVNLFGEDWLSLKFLLFELVLLLLDGMFGESSVSENPES